MRLLLLLSLLWICSASDDDKLDRYIIACHTTDFECFKRQYRYLRDNVLLGNDRLGINDYQLYTFRYGKSGTCIRLSGLEDSEMTGIQFNSATKMFTWSLDLPFRIEQIKNNTTCAKPDQSFRNIPEHKGPMKKFMGNATIQVSYPYVLRKKKGDVYMILDQENLDVVLDIPDLSQHNNASKLERDLFELSEWAYNVVQKVDAAQHFALPYTSQFHIVTENIPLKRLLLLYPDEEYVDLQFKYLDTFSKCYEKI